MKLGDKNVLIKISNISQIDLSIEAIKRALNGQYMRGVDIAPLMGVMGILEKIKTEPHHDCAENKKLRGLVEIVKDFLVATHKVHLALPPIVYMPFDELRTKIAELEKKTDSTDNVLIGEDDQMGNYL